MAPRELPVSSLPAIVPAAAFLAGVGCAPGPARLALLVAGLAASVTLALLRSEARTGAIAGSFLLAGAVVAAADARERALRTNGWLPPEGGSVEGAFEGQALAAPERGPDPDPDWRLRATLRPVPDPVPGARAAVVRLTVPATEGAGESWTGIRAGDRVRVWARIGRPRRPGNPGDPDPRVSLASRGDDATGWVKSGRLVEIRERGDASVGRAIDSVRSALRRRLDRALGDRGEPRALAGAMLWGDRGGLTPEVDRALRGSGLSHLVAVSGLHVVIVVGLVAVPLRPLRRRPVASALCLGLSVLLFTGLAGVAAPVARAALMALLALLARSVERPSDPRNSLAIVAATLVAVHPPWLHHAGFRLSVAAVAGIVTLAAPFAAFPLGPRGVRSSLAVSLAAYVATAPLLASLFQRLSPVALLANPPGIVLSTVVLGSGAVTVAVAGIPFAGPAAAAVTRESCLLLLELARVASEAPYATFRVAPPPSWLWSVHSICWGILLVAPARRKNARRLALAGLLLAVVAMHLGPAPRPGIGPSVAILDVGQGQAVAAWGAPGACLLLDAGGTAGGRFDLGERVVAPLLVREGCRRVEMLAISHGHDDHAGGAMSVLRDLEVGELWIPYGSARDAAIRSAVDAAIARGVAVRLAERGTESRAARWRVAAVHPSRADRHLPMNDRSLAVLLTAPDGSRLLVPGDLEKIGEERMLRGGATPSAQALVAAHHGARGSVFLPWLEAVGPRTVVVSAGAGNRFGHPHAEALDRFHDVGAEVLRTDRDGQVRLIPRSGSWRAAVTVPPSGTEPE